MSTNYEHRKIVDFVESFKVANKNTVQRIRKYDPKLRSWTFEIVKVNENAVKFSENIKKSKRNQREKEKRLKTTVAKPTNKTSENVVRKHRSEMRLNVVRLHKDGLKFKEIGDLYGVSESSTRTAYHREIHEK